MLGAKTIDEAEQRARTRVASAATEKITVRQACSLLEQAKTLNGLRAVATADARIVHFNEPGQPSRASRVVEVSAATADDAHIIGESGCAREKVSPDMTMTCGETCAGNSRTPLAACFRFKRVGGAMKIDLALLYTGS